MVYSRAMFEIVKTETFERWLIALRDRTARARIQARIDRLSSGNPGDVRPVRDGISELRIDHGPGYRVYFMRSGPLVIVLLVGGDKRNQDRDIEHAVELANDWRSNR